MEARPPPRTKGNVAIVIILSAAIIGGEKTVDWCQKKWGQKTAELRIGPSHAEREYPQQLSVEEAERVVDAQTRRPKGVRFHETRNAGKGVDGYYLVFVFSDGEEMATALKHTTDGVVKSEARRLHQKYGLIRVGSW